MNRINWLVIAVICSLMGACESSVKNEEKLISLDGTAAATAKGAMVMMIFVPDCPWAIRYAGEFQKLAKTFKSDSLLFVPLVSGNDYTKQEIENFNTEVGMDLKVYTEKNYFWSNKLNATTSPEFFLIDKNKNILYQGAFDNRLKDLGSHALHPDTLYLREAIDHYLKGEKITISKTKAIGCYLENGQ